MGQVESEAIVLRTYDLAESDKIAVCLTRQAGVVRAVARGARRLKSRFGAGLEPFTLVDLGYYEKEGRELVTLRHLEIRRSYFGLANRVESVAALAYMSELVLAFAPPHEPNEKLYRMVCACLEALWQTPTDVSQILRYFEVWTLKLAGFFSNPGRCVECLRELAAEEAIYMDAELRPKCVGCGKGRGATVSAETRAQLQQIQKLPPGAYAQKADRMSVASQRELAQLTKRYLSHVLEREVLEPALFWERPA